MGQTGQAVCDFFERNNVSVLRFDDNVCAPNYISQVQDVDFEHVMFIVQSPGVPFDHPIAKRAQELDISIFSDIDIFVQSVRYGDAVSGEHATAVAAVRATHAPIIIGVTGTNGKSTTVSLIGQILKTRYKNVFIGGNIGVPALALPIYYFCKPSCGVSDGRNYSAPASPPASASASPPASASASASALASASATTPASPLPFFSEFAIPDITRLAKYRPIAHAPVSLLDRDVLLDTPIYVLELSSYQLALSHTLALDMGVLTNISPDHLDRHGSLRNYVRAKKMIFANKGSDAMICVDDESAGEVLRNIAEPTRYHWSFSSTDANADVFVDSKGVARFRGGEYFDIAQYSCLIGAHNWMNTAMACTVGKLFDITANGPLVASLRGLPHRIEIAGTWPSAPSAPEHKGKPEYAPTSTPVPGSVFTKAPANNGVGGGGGGDLAIGASDDSANSRSIVFVNDSKATNAASTIKALESFKDSPIFLIAGGKPKRDGILPATAFMNNVRGVFLIGEACARFADELGAIEHIVCGDLRTALYSAFSTAKMWLTPALNHQPAHLRGQHAPVTKVVVLLSPACASFDQFKNYEDRGNVFKSLVSELLSDNANG
jgi:UDP-N-acetylmuramoylalanine--D-glutamate ligase